MSEDSLVAGEILAGMMEVLRDESEVARDTSTCKVEVNGRQFVRDSRAL
jgi:hypothetical protein